MEIKILTMIVTVVACLMAVSRSQISWFDRLTLKLTHGLTVISTSLAFLVFILEAEPLYLLPAMVLALGLTASLRFDHYLIEIMTLPFAFGFSFVTLLVPLRLESLSWGHSFIGSVFILIGPLVVYRISLGSPEPQEKLLWGEKWSPKTFPWRALTFRTIPTKYRRIPINLKSDYITSRN